jgi:hypothetical protein
MKGAKRHVSYTDNGGYVVDYEAATAPAKPKRRRLARFNSFEISVLRDELWRHLHEDAGWSVDTIAAVCRAAARSRSQIYFHLNKPYLNDTPVADVDGDN